MGFLRIFILIGLFICNRADAQLSVNCSSLNLGSFALDYGISGASDSGMGRVGVPDFIGSPANCIVVAPPSTSFKVTINNEQTLLNLTGSGGRSINSNVRLETMSGQNMGVSSTFVVPYNQNATGFKIDASVPSGQISAGGNVSANILIEISYN